LQSHIERRRERYHSLSLRLRAGLAANLAIHRNRIGQQRERVSAFGERAGRAIRQCIAVRSSRAERGGELLAAFSYRGVLARGFALVRDANHQPVRTAAAVSAGMPLEIEFSDGRVAARAESAATEHASVPGKPKPRRAGPSGQGDLF
jgi:exodeoxyribonuclease VII large subunit